MSRLDDVSKGVAGMVEFREVSACGRIDYVSLFIFGRKSFCITEALARFHHIAFIARSSAEIFISAQRRFHVGFFHFRLLLLLINLSELFSSVGRER